MNATVNFTSPFLRLRSRARGEASQNAILLVQTLRRERCENEGQCGKPHFKATGRKTQPYVLVRQDIWQLLRAMKDFEEDPANSLDR